VLSAICVLLTLVHATPAKASSITVQWKGSISWFNPDWLGNCQLSGSPSDCDFWWGLQALGIDISQPSSTPLSLSMTFADAISDANGFFATTADFHLELGHLGLVTYNAPVWLGNGLAFLSNGWFSLVTSFGPNTAPLAGYGGQRPGALNLTFGGWFGGVSTAAPNVSLVTTLAQLPPSSLSVQGCISLGGDCDVVAELSVAKVTVPEPNMLLSMSGAIVAFGLTRLRRSRSDTR
jgi:hypothetical protein